MWNPFRNPAAEAAQARAAHRETPEGQAEAARETEYIVAMERADTEPEQESVRQQWADPTYEPDLGDYIRTPEQVQETVDWADWADEMRPGYEQDRGDEASL